MTDIARQRTAFLPDFCGVRMVAAVILIGELLAIVLTLAAADAKPALFQILALHSLFIQWVALSCVALLCLLRRYLNQLPDVWSALWSYLIMLAVTLVVSEAAWWLLNVMPEASLSLGRAHREFLFANLGISGVVSALALRYFYIQHQWQRHVRAEAEARLQALQARIRPHFLFNCMNTIASLTRKQPAQAEQAIEDLADLFRLSLQESRTWLSLAEEFDVCRRYLRTEQLRLGERLQVDWNVDALPEDACVPALLIQPLLENAVYHGIEPLAAGGSIRIHGRRQQDRLTLVVDNPLTAGADRHQGNQQALDNIRGRLQSAFDDEADLRIEAAADRYRITLNLPYDRRPCAS